MALTKAEIRRLEKAKAWWRPILGFAGSLVLVAVVFTVCFMVLTGMAKLDVAMSFFVSLPPSLAALLGIQSAGRSYEKGRDNAHYSMDDYHQDSTTTTTHTHGSPPPTNEDGI